MSTTVKRITLALNKGESKKIDDLMEIFGCTTSDVLKHGLLLLHYCEMKKQEKSENQH